MTKITLSDVIQNNRLLIWLEVYICLLWQIIFCCGWHFLPVLRTCWEHCSLEQQYGLTKTANEVSIMLEAYRNLRDRGHYPPDHVVLEIKGKFEFILYDSTLKSAFAAGVSSSTVQQLLAYKHDSQRYGSLWISKTCSSVICAWLICLCYHFRCRWKCTSLLGSCFWKWSCSFWWWSDCKEGLWEIFRTIS